jgi:glycoside/pentoside/hexuronide:cation symporter, GPH family
MNEELPSRKSLLNYSLIALPLAFAGLPLYIHMPDFYTREFGINIGVLGLILLIIRTIDAVQDPFIGYISDRIRSKRPALIYAGGMLLISGLAGLSFGPPLTEISAFWFALFMLLATTGFSIVTINMNMLGGFWKKDPHQRVRVSSWREGFGLIGLLIAALLPTLLQIQFEDKTSFSILFLGFAILVIPAFVLFRRFMIDFQTLESSPIEPNSSSFSLFLILAGQERSFFLICFLSYLAASIPAALVLFFIRDYLEAEAFSGVFLALYFISGAAFMGMWARVTKKYGSYRTWACVMVLSIIAFGGAAFLSPGDIVAYGLICIMSGVVLGADLALPPAITAGRIERKAQEKQATQYYAALAFLPKLALALAAGLSFIALENVGFKADDNNSEEALQMLLIIYAIVPCVIKTISSLLLWKLIKQEGQNNEIFERNINHGNSSIS